MAVEITDEAMFNNEVLGSSEPVLVDFFATWCGPCRMLAPTIDEISAEYEGKVKVYKLDIDKLTPIALNYGVMSVPTLVLFKDGEPADQKVGVRPKGEIEEMLK